METFYYVFQSFLGWDLEHYLHNFVTLLPEIEATTNRIWMKSDNYAHPTDIFGIPQEETKYLERMVVSVLSTEVDTNLFMASLPRDKFYKECELVLEELNKETITFLEI